MTSLIGQDGPMTADVLTARALNRATLARQFLLERTERPAVDVIGHLVGMQAQEPHNPYLALWSRLEGFRPDELSQLLLDRKVVRIVVMRGTVHLVTADDCLVLRPLVQPVLDKEIARHPEFAPGLVGVDLEPVLAFVRELVADQPHSGRQLRAALADRFPEHHAAALAYACRNFLPFVQVPPRGVWGRSAQVSSTTAEAWLGRPLATDPSIDDVVLRYFGAFGPATVADVAAWSRLTGFREIVERLRPRLRTFRDERGRELFDLPDAPRPDPGTPAPARFLPEYDNVLLSHADRTRFASDEDRARLFAGERTVRGTVLHDGTTVGTWWIDRPKGGATATIVVDHLGGLPERSIAEVGAEAAEVVRFQAGDAEAHDVRMVALG
jgi:hypothetical protein